jgi:hypothetical protein
MPEPQALNLAVFAELTARMAVGAKRSDVLAEAKVDVERWEASQQFWLTKMADEAARDRYALSMKYAALYQEALTRITAQTAQAKKAVKRRAVVEPNRVVVHAAPAVPAQPAPVAVAPGVPSTRAPAAPVAHVARLTVEQLAAMRAELATSPDAEHTAVRQRFGLDEATWALEEAHWQRKLAVDKDLFGRYLKRFQYCRSLLQRA